MFDTRFSRFYKKGKKDSKAHLKWAQIDEYRRYMTKETQKKLKCVKKHKTDKENSSAERPIAAATFLEKFLSSVADPMAWRLGTLRC